VVADGVGGAPAGHIASHLAVEQIEDYVTTRDHSAAPSSTLHDAVTLANDAINKRGRQDGSARGMATTVVACLLTKERVFVAHAGDSRAYLITPTEITRLTEDHSLVAELLSSGRITPEEARNHPYRHVITRALGIAVRTHVELGSYPWAHGHHLLLCTDGLTEPIADQTIYTVIVNEAGDLHRKCARLIALANAEGGLDNVTVVLAQHT